MSEYQDVEIDEISTETKLEIKGAFKEIFVNDLMARIDQLENEIRDTSELNKKMDDIQKSVKTTFNSVSNLKNDIVRETKDNVEELWEESIKKEVRNIVGQQIESIVTGEEESDTGEKDNILEEIITFEKDNILEKVVTLEKRISIQMKCMITILVMNLILVILCIMNVLG